MLVLIEIMVVSFSTLHVGTLSRFICWPFKFHISLLEC